MTKCQPSTPSHLGSFYEISFDFGFLLQGQIRVAILKTPNNLLVIGPMSLGCVINLYYIRKSCCEVLCSVGQI